MLWRWLTRSAPHYRTLWRLLSVAAILAPAVMHAVPRADTDTVTMKNGDSFTGEIRSLSHETLTIFLRYGTNDFSLNWRDVRSIQSSQRFTIVTTRGVETGYGLSGTPQHMETRLAPDGATVSFDNVIELEEESLTFLPNLHGEINAGYGTSGSDTVSSTNIDANLSYLTRPVQVGLLSTTQLYTSPTTYSNNTLVQGGVYFQKYHSPLYAAVLTSFITSTEQQVRLRSSTGGGLGLHAIATRRASLDAAAGLAYTHETLSIHPDEAVPNTGSSMDAVVAIDASYDAFKHIDLASSDWFYPGVTDAGRLRMNLTESIYYRLPNNLHAKFTMYDYFDNKLPANTPAHDIGGYAAIGWSFH